MSISTYAQPRILDALFNNTSLAITATWAKLHIGNPGEACTANPAANTTRQSASWGAAVNGTITNDAALTWSSVSTTETYTHLSVWDASTAGNALWYMALLAAYPVIVGDTFTIAIGGVTITLD